MINKEQPATLWLERNELAPLLRRHRDVLRIFAADDTAPVSYRQHSAREAARLDAWLVQMVGDRATSVEVMFYPAREQ